MGISSGWHRWGLSANNALLDAVDANRPMRPGNPYQPELRGVQGWAVANRAKPTPSRGRMSASMICAPWPSLGTGSTYPADVEARALGRELAAAADRGQRVPCRGMEPDDVAASTCTTCPLSVRTACGDYGRAANAVGPFGGERHEPRHSSH